MHLLESPCHYRNRSLQKVAQRFLWKKCICLRGEGGLVRIVVVGELIVKFLLILMIRGGAMEEYFSTLAPDSYSPTTVNCYSMGNTQSEGEYIFSLSAKDYSNHNCRSCESHINLVIAIIPNIHEMT